MKKTKVFLTVNSEKKWLEKMAERGYALKKRAGFCYIFEKKNNVKYQYVFLKNGRKSFLQLDYKKRDSDCRFIYGNSNVALFCKDGQSPSVLTESEIKINYLRRKQKCTTTYLCLIMIGCSLSALARIITPMWIIAGLCLAAAFVYIFETRGIDKMVKKL